MTLFLVGGYTGDAGSADGIGLIRAEGAEIEFLGTVAETGSPSWVLVDGDRVFAVDEDAATVSSWRRRGARLELERTVGAGGAGPCHLAADGDGLLVACYGGGVLTRVPLDGAGVPSGDGVVLLTGSGGGLHPDQTAGHLHSSAVRDDGRAVALDLGADVVHLLDRDRVPEVAIAVPAGTGPRDVRLLSDGRMLILGELASTLLVLSADGDLQEVVELPGAERGDHAAALALAPIDDGWRVVSGLRGSGRIAVVDLLDSGGLRAVGSASAGGAGPRHLVREGDLIHVALQSSSEIATLRLLPDGRLEHLGTAACPTPSRLVPVGDDWAELAR